jgi:hypothetical protein
MDLARLVEVLEGVDVTTLDDDELAAAVLEQERLVAAVAAFGAVLHDEFAHRGRWALDGARSGATWIAARTGARAAVLAASARTGAALRALPDVATMARSGRLGVDAQRELGRVARSFPAATARDEALFVEWGSVLDADGFAAVLRQWRAAAEDEAREFDATHGGPVEEPSRLHLSRSFDGRWQLDGSLTDADGRELAAVLDAGVERLFRSAATGDPSLERRPASELRAVALLGLVAQEMRDPGPRSVPDRYRVAVTVRADELERGGFQTCDAYAYRVVVGAAGEVLDVGRAAARWTPAIRRAITARDGGCVFPGCDRPPSWCDVHHCTPWAEGGVTAVDNGALLCRHHHHFLHERAWTVQIPAPRAAPQVFRSDGTRYRIDRRPGQVAA